MAEPEPFRTHEKALFGQMAYINPEAGEFYPPQLPEVVQYVHKNWGWEISNQVRQLLQQGN